MTDQEFEEFRATRKEAGERIDPLTAEVMWVTAQTLDPYGIDPDLPEELWQIGAEFFARSPDSDIWVLSDDLPAATYTALRERDKQERAFPAGLSPVGEVPRDTREQARAAVDRIRAKMGNNCKED
jgi:hypothetical protein